MQFGSVPPPTGSVFVKNPLAPCGFEGVHLGGKVLVFFFGNAGVTDKHRGFKMGFQYNSIMKPDFETVKVGKRAGEGKGFKNGRLMNNKLYG